MKKLYKNTRSSILILTFIFSVSALAKPGVLIGVVTGNVFSIINGKTVMLKKDDHLGDNSEIVTEEGSMVSFTDYHDHKYHLSGSAQVKMFGGTIELTQGYMWAQSFNRQDSKFLVQSANAIIGYKNGEAIISFDPYTGKTQVFSLDGKFEISNILKKDIVEIVDRGEFSFVSNDYENGIPRRATELSRSSYDLVRALFPGVDPVLQKEKRESLATLDFDMPTSRRPASMRINTVNMNDRESNKDRSKNNNGKVIYLRKDRNAESRIRDLRLENYYNKVTQKLSIPKKKRRFKPTYKKSSNVKIKIYGSPYKHNSKKMVKSYLPKRITTPKKNKIYRVPASISKIQTSSTNEGSEFESSLVNEFKKQMRHSNEVNQLIDELKNYNQDYKTNY